MDWFLSLVEIKTKAASMIPLLFGTVYAVYRYEKFDALNFFLFFFSLIFIDMAATALNNYYDSKRAVRKEGYNYTIHNSIIKNSLSDNIVIFTIITMACISVAAGMILVWRTDFIVLIAGVASFIVAAAYSAGPVPISRTPFGEIFSGFFMGCVITFLSIYIHIHELRIIDLRNEGAFATLTIDYSTILSIFAVALPLFFCIANIMLANNICDIDDDIKNSRYTLPVYIGREKSLTLFKLLYYCAFLTVLVCVFPGRILPWSCLLVLPVFFLVNRNIKLFKEEQNKKDTFSLSVINLFYIGIAYIIILLQKVLFTLS